MAVGFNLTSFDKAFKDRYSSKFVDNMTYGPNRLYALLKKGEEFSGRNLTYPVMFGDVQSASANFTQAQTNMATAASSQVQFALTRVKDYSPVSVDNETMLASRGNEGAFFDTVFSAVDGAFRTAARRMNIALYRSGWGEMGTCGSVSTTAITLSNKQDAVNFEVGQEYVGSTSINGAVLNASGASSKVTLVNRNTGVVTFAATMATICPAASFLFIKGDREDSATPVARKISGLEAWCPESAPGATAFFGVARNVDTRLGGNRFDGSALNLEETLIEAGIELSREGGSPDIVIFNPKNYGDLIKSLGSKVSYIDVKTGDVGFRALEVHLPTGTVKIVPDRDCPVNVGWMLQADTWKFHSLGKAPMRLPTAEGEGRVTASADDGIEFRIGWYGNLACYAPGWNSRIKLA